MGLWYWASFHHMLSLVYQVSRSCTKSLKEKCCTLVVYKIKTATWQIIYHITCHAINACRQFWLESGLSVRYLPKRIVFIMAANEKDMEWIGFNTAGDKWLSKNITIREKSVSFEFFLILFSEKTNLFPDAVCYVLTFLHSICESFCTALITSQF